VAIFIALSGTAVATQVAERGAESAKKKVKRGPPGPAGPAGAQGPQGPQGAQGVPGPATGNAGGDLTGTYPNPTLAPGAVGTADIGTASVALSKFGEDLPQARVTHSTSQSVNSGTDTTLAFDDERYDFFDLLHDNVTNNSRLTNPASGTTSAFAITASVHFAANATGERTVTLMKNGATPIARESRPAASSGPTIVNVSTLASLAGDGAQYVEVVVNQTSGGPLNVLKTDELSPEFAMGFLPTPFD
jgi:hypothetical protein